MSSVFHDFRHRKIVQWSLAYLAGAWVLLQVATTVGAHFGWSPSVLRGLTIVLAVGLPITLVLAWYHGEKGQQRVSGPELLMVAALLVVAGAALMLVRGGRGEAPVPEESDPPATVAADRSSIAVLPFTNLSGDPEQEYFSDGMTEEIIGHLAKVDGLKVISRTSVMQYKNTSQTIREIAGELGVATVLEGSIRREGDRVRVTAQLIDASSDAHLWAETYDREVESVFAIQSDVATSIARALEVELSVMERERIERIPTSSQEAYQLYQRGRYFWNRRGHQNLQRALDLFEQAVEADPDFALAHVAIAETYLLLRDYMPREEALQEAEAAAKRALELDPTSGEAYVTLAGVAYTRWEWERAGELFARGIELSPGYATARQWHAEYLIATGYAQRAVAEAERAHELDPQSMIITGVLADAYYSDRRYDEAIAQARAATEMTEEIPYPYSTLVLALQQASRYPEAIEALSALVRVMRGPEAGDEARERLTHAWRERGERGYWEVTARILEGFDSVALLVAVALIHSGDRDGAFERLERSIETRFSGQAIEPSPFHPSLDPIRDDPRFLRLAERMGLPPRARPE